MKNRNLNEADKAVYKRLSAIGVTFDAIHLHMDESDPSWKHDVWNVGFTSGSKHMQTIYKTGLGHRVGGVPVRPTAASVLCCLLSDADSADQSFADWCSDFGYDTDSRKALDTYIACGEIARGLRKVFSPEQLAHLRELLEDY